MNLSIGDVFITDDPSLPVKGKFNLFSPRTDAVINLFSIQKNFVFHAMCYSPLLINTDYLVVISIFAGEVHIGIHTEIEG